MKKYVFILLTLLLGVFLLSLLLGSVQIPFGEILDTLWSGEHENKAWEGIVLKIRLPKAITALLVGGALGVAGLQMQTLFRNPLAGPSVLGITAGASLGVALIVLTGASATAILTLNQLGIGESWLMLLAATSGAGLVFLLILAISVKVKNNVALLIIGLMVGNMTIALVSIWQYFSSPELIKDFLLWTFGNLGGVSNQQLLLLVLVVTIGVLGTFAISKPLDMLLLGEGYAKSMGLNVQISRITIILLTSLLAGAVTGFCGPIGFIGIAIPHIARQIFKTSNHKVLIPCSFLLGSIVLLICDIIAQLPNSHSILPINAVTAFFGSPVVIWVMMRKRRSVSSDLEKSQGLGKFSPSRHHPIELKTEKITVGYGKKVLLKNLNLELSSGKVIALLGPNGAGKSTLLRSIAGLQAPLSGNISLNNSDWGALPHKEKAKHLGVVLTEKDFFGNLKVAELVMMGRYVHTDWWAKLTQRDTDWVNWALGLVGIRHFAQREISSLSDGERQKALIARLLVQDTPVLLLDEPTAHLDLPNRIKTFRLLEKLAKEHKKAILFSTHELDLALQMADEIWLVDDGRNLEVGSPIELKHDGRLEKVFGDYFNMSMKN